MINSVRVYNFAQTKEIINGNKETNYNAWITVTDEEDSPTVEALKRRNLCRKIPHLTLFFMDVSENSTLKFNLSKGPKQKHIDKIYEFLKHLHDSTVIYNLGINCFAGISRSTAAAIIAFAIKNETPAEALDSLLRIQPYAFPNITMLKLAGKYIGKEYYNYVKKWESESNEIYIPTRAWN